MTHYAYHSPARMPSKARSPGAPLVTLAESADRVGLTWQALACALRSDPDAPVPVMRRHIRGAQGKTKATYYKASEMTAWLVKVCGSSEGTR